MCHRVVAQGLEELGVEVSLVAQNVEELVELEVEVCAFP